MDHEVVHIAMLGISQGAADEVAAQKLAIEMAGAAGHRVVAQAIVPDIEAAIRVQLAAWIIDPQIDAVIVTMDTRSKAVSAAVRPLIVERVPGLIEAARCEKTYVIVLLPGASSVKAAMQHRILARLDSRQDNNLTTSMPRLRDRTVTDAVPAAASVEQTGKDAIPARVEKERTASGAGVHPRLPAASAAMRAAAVPLASTPTPAAASTPSRKPQATGKHVVSRGATPHEAQTAPIDLVAMMPQLPPGADQEIDLDKDIPVFLPDPAPRSVDASRERSAPRTRPPTAPPPGRHRPPTAPVQTIPPAGTARTRPPTAPPPGRARPPTGQQPTSTDGRSRSPTGGNRPATLAVAVVPPPPPVRSKTTSSGPTPSTKPLPRVTSSASAPAVAPTVAAPTSGAAKLAEAWSSPTKAVTEASDDAAPRKVLKLKLASPPPRQETSQAAIRLSQAWSAASADDDEDDDSLLPEAPMVAADGVADTVLADAAPKPAAARPAEPAPVTPNVTAELDAADVESVDGEPEPDAPSPMAALLSRNPSPPKAPPQEEPSFAQSLVTPMPRDSAQLPVYASNRSGKRTLLVALLLLVVVGGGVFAYSKLGGDKRPAAAAQLEADAAVVAPDAAVVAMAIDAAAEEPAIADAAIVAEIADAAVAEPEPEPPVATTPTTTAKTTPKTTAKTTPKTVAKTREVAVQTPPKTEVKPPDPPKEEPKPQVAAGCDEVSCVMDNYARACCARYKPAGETFTPKRSGTPDELDKTMIRVGVGRVKPAVIACGEKSSAKGTVKIAMVVGPDGSVRGATVADAPDAALGTCVASALKRAKFQATVKGGTFTYPFVF